MKYPDYSRLAPKLKNATRVSYLCDFCGEVAWEKKSSFNKKKRHFCSSMCYSKYRKYQLPKEEHNRFGTGYSEDERLKRVKARSTANHAVRDGKLERKPCEVEGCVNWPEAHHENYDKPLEVRWLCFNHHRELHKKIYENPELLERQQCQVMA